MLRGGQLPFLPIYDPIVELIGTARRGDRVSVGKLAHILMQDIGNYTVDIFDALVSQLRPDVLTKVVQALNEGRQLPAPLLFAKETGSMAISGVYMAPLGCAKHPGAKQATVSIIQGNLSTILTWILVDLGHRPGFVDTSKPVKAEEPSFVLHAGLLRGVMDLDPSLEEDILASPVAVDIALVLWSTLTHESQPLFLAQQRFRIYEAGCAIIDVVLRFVRIAKRDNPAPIIQRLSAASTPCDEATFVDRLIARGNLLISYAQAKQDTMNYLKILESCRAMLDINQALLLRHPQTIGAAIRETTNNVVTYCNLLTPLARARVDGEVEHRFTERLSDLFNFVFSQWVLGSSTSFQRHLSDSLQSGRVVTAVCSILKNRLLSRPGMEKLYYLIKMVKDSFVFPVSANVVFRQVLTHGEWTLLQGQVLREPKVPFIEIRTEFLALSLDMKDSYQSIPRRFPICDNLAHHLTNPPMFINAKACSNCQSVTYCSKLCQTQDWGPRHQFECKPARRVYLEQKQEERRYRQRMRAHHLAFTIRYFHNSLAGKYGPVIAENRDAPSPMVAFIDLKGFPFTPSVLTLEEYAREERLRVPTHLRRRFDEMVALAMEPEAADEPMAYRMVHSEVGFGRERVSIIGIVTRKDTIFWSGGGPRVMISMCCTRPATEEEDPPTMAPQFEQMVLSERLLKESMG